MSNAGAFIVNTGSCQLIDDCALKQLLIDGTIAGCALDGAEGPQWMEAWVWNLLLSQLLLFGYSYIQIISIQNYLMDWFVYPNRFALKYIFILFFEAVYATTCNSFHL